MTALAQLGKSIYGAGKSFIQFCWWFFMASQDAVNASGLPSNQFGLTKVQPNIVDVKYNLTVLMCHGLAT